MSEWIKKVRALYGKDLLIVNSAGGWVENEQGCVLLQKRTAEEEQWGFPGGILELGESVEEAAVRELKEETGFDVKIVGLIGVYSKYFSTQPNGDECQTFSTFFRMKIVGGQEKIDMQETFGLRFVDTSVKPNLFCRQHEDMWDDAVAGGEAIFR